MSFNQINEFLNGTIVLKVSPEYCDEVVQIYEELGCNIAGDFIRTHMKHKYPYLYFVHIDDNKRIIACGSFSEAKTIAKDSANAVPVRYKDNVSSEIDDTFLDLI